MTARRKDTRGRARVHQLLSGPSAEFWRGLTHRELAVGAQTTYETVRAVRRELGDVGITPRKPTCKPSPIGTRLLRSLEPRHVAALQRLAAAHAKGSDMQTRAVLASPEMQQLLTAAKEMTT